VVDWAKALVSVPVSDMPVMPRAMLPVLERVTVWAALVEPLSVVKLSDGGVRDADWTAAATVTATGIEVLVAISLSIKQTNSDSRYAQVAGRHHLVPARFPRPPKYMGRVSLSMNSMLKYGTVENAVSGCLCWIHALA
jgi:hypothetical protein